MYGVVDFLDPHFGMVGVEKDKRAELGPWKGEFTESEILEAMNDRKPENAMVDALSWNEPDRVTDTEISKLWATDFKYTRPHRLRCEVHQYRSTRLSLKRCFQPERFKDEEGWKDWLVSQSALRQLDGRKTYPPTAFLHGTGDEAVPLEQSQRMAEKLRAMGVPTVECYEPGGPHVFDNVYKVRDRGSG